MKVINPAKGSAIRELDEDDRESVAKKVAAARAAQPAWARRPYAERRQLIARFQEIVREREDELARTLSEEVGKPITQSHNELKSLHGRLDFFLESTARELESEVMHRESGLEERIDHEALGVVANVSAWNYPYFVGANVFVPALLTGCVVLYKPSEFAPLTGLAIARALSDAGAPDNVFNLVIGGPSIGATLVDQPVDAVFFTGSYATGKKIAQVVAPRLGKLQLELGGKDPAYIADDVADVAGVAASVADGAFYNNGQSCCAVERVYVHEAIWEQFLKAFVDSVKSFKLGDPLDPDTYIGPLARREAAIQHLEAQVADATGKGASIECGGARLKHPGYYFEPTVLSGVNHEMQVMREETFGPVIGLMPVKDDQAARELMADTEYGLTAAVYSAKRERAEAILRDLEVGSAYFNCCDRVSPRLPWTGRKHSGVGVTLSHYGIETFLKPKAFHLRG